MRKSFLFLSSMIFVFFMGCHNVESIVPEKNNGINGREWVKLYKPGGLQIESSLVSSERIDGSTGGELVINKTYGGGARGEINISARLVIEPNSFTGEKVLTMILDAENGTATFAPAITFAKEAVLNFTIDGYDTRELIPTDIDFEYFAQDGKFYPIQYRELALDITGWKLEVSGAKIPHFSRYGFTKRSCE